MDNNEDIKKRRYYEDEEIVITNKIETRTPNEIADDNYKQALSGVEQFQVELYRQVLLARGVNPDEVNIDSLINGENTMDEVVEKYKSIH